jgi:BirA family biotin operon repressor/biotin-[acetyl-CoA-carboxylase] ligase
MHIIKLDEATSTNTVAAEMGDAASHGTAVWALTQSAGRGQRGNTWEAEPGKNLTFSVVLRPTFIAAARQFELSMLVSLAIVRVLQKYLRKDVSIKWPNDIYVGDMKICGILIENSLSGSSIDRSIVGVGLNVNQTAFVSNAPNPVSMTQITGETYNLEALVNEFVSAIVDAVDGYGRDMEPDELQVLYAQLLWRGDGGSYRWIDTATNRIFSAKIKCVDATGMLTLRLDDGTTRTYAFKEVLAVLK